LKLKIKKLKNKKIKKKKKKKNLKEKKKYVNFYLCAVIEKIKKK